MNPLQEYMDRIHAAIMECNAVGYENAQIIWGLHKLRQIPIKIHGPMIFSAPLLDEKECNDLLEYAKVMADKFQVNQEEEAAYQVDELVICHYSKALFADLLNLMSNRVTPLFQIMTGHTPGKVSSIQLARYKPSSTSKSDWHVDEQSDLTCVVSLGPELHTGGGTYLRPYGPAGETIFVEALPKGHALFFNGRAVHHRGAEVRNGVRNLLVFWLMQK